MSSATKPRSFSVPSKPPNGTPDGRKVNKDRITFGIVLALVALLIGLMVWLASISPGLESGYYHHWMP